MSRTILSKLNRRTVLRGVGSGLALPLLESMRMPGLLAATTAAPMFLSTTAIAMKFFVETTTPTDKHLVRSPACIGLRCLSGRSACLLDHQGTPTLHHQVPSLS